MKKALIMISVLSTVLCACDDLEFNGDILDMDGNPIVVTDQDEKCTETKTECDQNNILITCVKDKAPELTPCGNDSTCGEDPDNPGAFKCLAPQDVCTEDKIECEGKTLITCVKDNPQKTKECPVKCGADPDKAGSFKCLEDEQPTLCTDNGTSCGENNTLVTCVKDQEPVSKPCNANQTCGKDPKNTDAYKCLDNEQIPDCTEDKTECSGNNLITCMKGQKPHTEACGDDKTCGQDSKKEGTFKCNDNAPKTCTEGNTRCGENNTLFTCQEGTEIPTPCGDQTCGQDSDDGIFKCIDNEPQKTCENGKTWCGENNTLITCPEGTEMLIPCGDQTCGEDPNKEGAFKCNDNAPQTCDEGTTWCDESTNSLHICKDGKDIETDCYDNTCGEAPNAPGTYDCLPCLTDFNSYKLKEAHKCICDALKYDAIQDKNQCNAWGVVISSQNINSLQESLKQNLCSDIKYIKLKGSIQFPTESDKISFLNNCKSLESTVLIGKDAIIKAYPRYPMFEEIKNSKVHNLNIVPDIKTISKDDKAHGILANKVETSTISDIHFEGNFTTKANNTVGGLFGSIVNLEASAPNSNFAIENVSFTGNITANDATKDIGGIAGKIENSTVGNAHFHGILKAGPINNQYKGDNIGGITGSSTGTIFNNIFVKGTDNNGAQILTETGSNVGGLIGEMKGGSIENNTQNNCNDYKSKINLITGTRNVGGAIGTVNNTDSNMNSKISNISIEVNEIKTNNRDDNCNGACCECVIGGFMGYGHNIEIAHCAVNAKTISGGLFIGGFAGEIDFWKTNHISDIQIVADEILSLSDINVGGFIGKLLPENTGSINKIQNSVKLIKLINAETDNKCIVPNNYTKCANRYGNGMGGFIGIIDDSNSAPKFNIDISDITSVVSKIISEKEYRNLSGFIGTLLLDSENSKSNVDNVIKINNIYTSARTCVYSNEQSDQRCSTTSSGLIFKMITWPNMVSLNNITSVSYRYETKQDVDKTKNINYKSTRYVTGSDDSLRNVENLTSTSKVYYYAFNNNESYSTYLRDYEFNDEHGLNNNDKNLINSRFIRFKDKDFTGMLTSSVIGEFKKNNGAQWDNGCLNEATWTTTFKSPCTANEISVPYFKLTNTCTIP